MHAHPDSNVTTPRRAREDDQLWIDRFAQTLRRSDPRLAGDDAPDNAIAAARAAFGNPDLHSLEPEVAAAHWVAAAAQRREGPAADGGEPEPRDESALESAGRAISEPILGAKHDDSVRGRR